MKTMKTFAAAFAFGAVALTSAAFADVGVTSEAWEREVRFNPSSLADPIAVDALHRDIVAVAREACGRPGRDVRARAHRNTCVRNAVEAAVSNANIASLSVLHANLAPNEKFNLARATPNQDVLRMVAEAGGQSRAAGTIGAPKAR